MLTADMLMDALNGVRDEHIMAAGSFLGLADSEAERGRLRRLGRAAKVALLAAVLAALLAACTFAVHVLGLSGRVIGPGETAVPELGEFTSANRAAAAAIENMKKWSILAPVGDANSPEAKALAEWVDFERAYSAAMDAAGKAAGEPSYAWEDYEAAAAVLGHVSSLYQARDSFMAEKLLEIGTRYNLKLHTGDVLVRNEEELYSLLGTTAFLPEDSLNYAMVYEDGACSVSGRLHAAGTETGYSLTLNVAGTLPSQVEYVGFPEVAEYEEQNYVNLFGNQVCIARRVEGLKGYTAEGFHTFVFYDAKDASLCVHAVVPGGWENAEAFADCFDFAAVSGSREVEVPDLVQGKDLSPAPLTNGQGQVLYLLTSENASYKLQEAVQDFNAQNRIWTVEIIDGESGRDPDIYDLEQINYVNYIRPSLLEDLRPWFDADEEINYEDLLPEVLEILEQEGVLYDLTPGFGVETFAGYGAVLGDGDGLTVERLIEIAEDYSPLELFGGRVTREAFFRLLLELDWNSYVDTAAATCRFDSESFMTLLNFSRGLNAAEDRGIATPDAYAYNGELQLRQVFLTNMPVDLLLSCDGVFHGDARYVGFPSENGTGSTLCFAVRLGMAQSSENKDGVWAFFRFLLSDEMLTIEPDGGDGTWSDDSIPVRRSMLEKAMDYWTENYEVRGSVNLYGWEQMVIESVPDDGTAALRVMELIARADGLSWYDGEILNIILSGAEAFYAGRLSARDAAANIQERALMYLQGQKG